MQPDFASLSQSLLALKLPLRRPTFPAREGNKLRHGCLVANLKDMQPSHVITLQDSPSLLNPASVSLRQEVLHATSLGDLRTRHQIDDEPFKTRRSTDG